METRPKTPPYHVASLVQPGVVPLSALRAGERGLVVELAGGRGLLGRMMALGLTPGAEVTVLRNFGRGPLIALVRDTRVALGRGEAGRVHMRRVSHDQE
jgi:ferrous iron transport protein A